MTFRERLRQLMDERKLSVRRLCKESGVPFGTVASYLATGEKRHLPTLSVAVTLAKSLGVTVDAFSDCDEFQPQTESPAKPAGPTFREKLNQLRKAKGWSVKTLATTAGIPFGTVNSYVIPGPSARTPTLPNAILLARALGVSVAVFEECDFPKTGFGRGKSEEEES